MSEELRTIMTGKFDQIEAACLEWTQASVDSGEHQVARFVQRLMQKCKGKRVADDPASYFALLGITQLLIQHAE